MIRPRLRRVAIHLFAWGLAIGWLFPFVGLTMAAFRPFPEIVGGWWNFDPFTPSFTKFVAAFNAISFGFRNSLLIAVPASIIPMSVATLAGYGFARFSFPIRDYVFLTVVLLMTIPQHGGHPDLPNHGRLETGRHMAVPCEPAFGVGPAVDCPLHAQLFFGPAERGAGSCASRWRL